VFDPDKINVAALGNMVPQLHIHVIARFTDDAAWPQPVWGVAPAQAYAPEALDARLVVLQDAFAAS
jgi:diadenosine tetraphosphate (Ap4A) HIT family hydrolase